MALWDILRTLGIFYDHLVHFVFVWYIFSGFGIAHQGKSGNPGRRSWVRFFSGFRDAFFSRRTHRFASEESLVVRRRCASAASSSLGPGSTETNGNCKKASYKSRL
jgi:hypothetical protein